ncbi:Lhr-like helicase [Paraburkholderia sp. MM6662-R1]
MPFDVLVQHPVTVAIGGGFDALELYDELLHTYAYRDLTQQEFDWTLGFVEGGGAPLQWAGSRMPLSSELADATLTMLARAADGIYDEPELRAVRPLLELQQKWSALPEPDVLVVELLKSRGSPLLLLSVRETHCAYRTWRSARVASRARQARHVFDFDQRLRFRIAVRAGFRLGRAITGWPAFT